MTPSGGSTRTAKAIFLWVVVRVCTSWRGRAVAFRTFRTARPFPSGHEFRSEWFAQDRSGAVWFTSLHGVHVSALNTKTGELRRYALFGPIEPELRWRA